MVFDIRFSSGVMSVESTAAREGNRARRVSRLYGRLLKLRQEEEICRVYSESAGRIWDVRLGSVFDKVSVISVVLLARMRGATVALLAIFLWRWMATWDPTVLLAQKNNDYKGF